MASDGQINCHFEKTKGHNSPILISICLKLAKSQSHNQLYMYGKHGLKHFTRTENTKNNISLAVDKTRRKSYGFVAFIFCSCNRDLHEGRPNELVGVNAYFLEYFLTLKTILLFCNTRMTYFVTGF